MAKQVIEKCNSESMLWNSEPPGGSAFDDAVSSLSETPLFLTTALSHMKDGKYVFLRNATITRRSDKYALTQLERNTSKLLYCSLLVVTHHVLFTLFACVPRST